LIPSSGHAFNSVLDHPHLYIGSKYTVDAGLWPKHRAKRTESFA